MDAGYESRRYPIQPLPETHHPDDDHPIRIDFLAQTVLEGSALISGGESSQCWVEGRIRND
jgi:hypothetical protein